MRASDNVRAYAKGMRRAPTAAEHLVWKWLRSRRFNGFKFRRQHPVGGFIVDFYCAELRLALELDGSHHVTPWGAEADGRRSLGLSRLGVKVVRVPNEVLRTDPRSLPGWLEAQIELRRSELSVG